MWIYNTMSLALYSRVASGWVAQQFKKCVMDLVSYSVTVVWFTDSLLRETAMIASMAWQLYRIFSITIYSRVQLYGNRVGVVSGGGVSWLLEPYVGDVHRYGVPVAVKVWVVGINVVMLLHSLELIVLHWFNAVPFECNFEYIISIPNL